jgi:hypothetical protein
MIHKTDILSKTHFHIRWSTSEKLDWASFATEEQADRRAKDLVKDGETFIIERRGPSCERCNVRTKAAH